MLIPSGRPEHTAGKNTHRMFKQIVKNYRASTNMPMVSLVFDLKVSKIQTTILQGKTQARNVHKMTELIVSKYELVY